MTEAEKKSAFCVINSKFPAGLPILPNDFREWGITTYKEARELMREFNEAEMKQGVRWVIEEKPYECTVISPVTGEKKEGSVTAFYGYLDRGWRNRSKQ